ncbi:hypothetical protein ACFV1N_38580 [Streptosporangium canum]|uniref:hypothetical protein n=1 Tax=Streptosporangium canum TaxID=324952 RepID=UPI0036A96873
MTDQTRTVTTTAAAGTALETSGRPGRPGRRRLPDRPGPVGPVRETGGCRSEGRA